MFSCEPPHYFCTYPIYMHKSTAAKYMDHKAPCVRWLNLVTTCQPVYIIKYRNDIPGHLLRSDSPMILKSWVNNSDHSEVATRPPTVGHVTIDTRSHLRVVHKHFLYFADSFMKVLTSRTTSTSIIVWQSIAYDPQVYIKRFDRGWLAICRT